jgi:hypothetical protein
VAIRLRVLLWAVLLVLVGLLMPVDWPRSVLLPAWAALSSITLFFRDVR